jgi:hypothetical protein
LLIEDNADRLRDIPYGWRFFGTNAKGQADRTDVNPIAGPKRGATGNGLSVHGRAALAPEVFDKPGLALTQYSTMAS